MRHYAQNTRVSPTATVEQIRKAVLGAGARRFATDETDEYAQIAFDLHGRTIRFRLEFPDPNDREFTHTAVQGYMREPAKARQLWETAIRQRWRALLLVIRAKVEAAASGIVTEEAEWLPYVVLSSNQTVSEWVERHPQLRAMVEQRDDAEGIALPERTDR